MGTNHMGRQSIRFPQPPVVRGFASVAGKKEREGPLGDQFTATVQDTTFGEKSWERAERRMQQMTLELALEKATLAAPADLRLVGTRLTWSPVVGASSYEIVLDGRSQTGTEPACDLADAVKWSEGADYTLTVKAVGASASSAPVSLTVRYNALFPTLTYQGSILSWRPVVGATA